MENIFITIKQLSESLNISINTIRGWIRLRQIPYYKIVGKIKFHLPVIRNWMEKMEVKQKEDRLNDDIQPVFLCCLRSYRTAHACHRGMLANAVIFSCADSARKDAAEDSMPAR